MTNRSARFFVFHQRIARAALENSTSRMRRSGMILGIFLIFIIIPLVYSPSIKGGFILDDELHLTKNESIKADDGLYRIWSTSKWQYYWPVTDSFFWIEWRMWGMRPVGYHATNLILHIADAMMIWLIMRKLFIPGAFLAALLFALHPVNVESVAWIASRKNEMATLFFLLAIYFYVKYLLFAGENVESGDRTVHADRPHRSSAIPGCWYWLGLAAFLLSALGKGSTVILPVILLGFIWLLRPVTRRDLALIGPFFLISFAIVAVNMWFQARTVDYTPIRVAGVTERLLGAGGVVWFYLYKALLPVNLALIYPLWHIDSGNLLWWLPLAAAMIATAILWRCRKDWSGAILFCWGFFCVALLPVMGFTDVGFMQYSLVADRYQHISVIGIIALASAAWGAWNLRMRATLRWPSPAIAVAAVGILGFLCWRQAKIYHDAFTMYYAVLEKNPNCWVAHNNLGSEYIEAGRLNEAIVHARKALDLAPDNPYSRSVLGTALDKSGRLQEAVEQYKRALMLYPDFAEVHNNLAGALVELGRPLEAIEHCRQAITIDPDYAKAYNTLGAAMETIGQTREAIEQYRRAVQLDPDYVDARCNLASALVKTGQLQEAIALCKRTLLLNPNSVAAHNTLGNAFQLAGQYQDAIEQYEAAIALDPGFSQAHINLGSAFTKIGRVHDAIEHYEKAIQINPNSFEAHNNLGNAFQSIGEYQQAVDHLQTAFRLNSDLPQVQINLAQALAQAGQLSEAIDHYRQVLQHNPGLAQVYFSLALTYAKDNQPSEAIDMAQKGLELARSQGDMELAGRIKAWLDSYRVPFPEKGK